MEHLVPTSFQLSLEHAMLWISLTNSIRRISELYSTKIDFPTNAPFKEGIDTKFGLNLHEFMGYLNAFQNQKLKS